MATSRSRKERKEKTLRICVISVIMLAVGSYMLFVMSTSLQPLFGMTFCILVGCVLMAVSSLVLLVTLKNYFFPKRKRKRSNVVFLEDELKKASQKNEPLQ